MLAARKLAFGYRDHVVGRDVSFTLSPGERLCLLGPNGGGKTTLFKTLLGLLTPIGGGVTVYGKSLTALSRGELARTLGYVPQAHATFFPFSVLEVVLMGRTAHIGAFDAPSEHDRRIAHQAAETLGIGRLADKPYTHISGGERQLTLIARALAQETQFLVMDEPTASLDLGNQARVLSRIMALSRSGPGVIFSTHDPDHAFACADRVILLHDGALAADGPPDSVLTPALLEQLYGVPVDISFVESLGRKVCAPILAPRERLGGNRVARP